MAKYKVEFTRNGEQCITDGSFCTKNGAQKMADAVNNSNGVWSSTTPVYGTDAFVIDH